MKLVTPWQLTATEEHKRSWKEKVTRASVAIQADPQRKEQWLDTVKVGMEKRNLVLLQMNVTERASVKKARSEATSKSSPSHVEKLVENTEATWEATRWKPASGEMEYEDGHILRPFPGCGLTIPFSPQTRHFSSVNPGQAITQRRPCKMWWTVADNKKADRRPPEAHACPVWSAPAGRRLIRMFTTN
jgi:hypothetical protein